MIILKMGELPKLKFGNQIISSGDIEELENIAFKNSSTYRNAQALNNGEEISL